jgi:tetratricopeptide (TPR) repeat protein
VSKEKLIELIKEGKVIPFVGAGVSMAVKDKSGKELFCSWKELLKSLANEIEDENKKTNALSCIEIDDAFTYLEKADNIKKFLNINSFNNALKKVISTDIDYDSVDETTYSLAKSIWRISNLIITTNYDKVLYHASDSKNTQRVVKSQSNELSNILKDGTKSKTIWHIHGYDDDIESIVLTTDSYKELYDNETVVKNALKTLYDNETVVKNALKTLLSTKTFLFVGFSLDDEYVVGEMCDLHDLYGGNMGDHYVLFKEGTNPSNLQDNIKPIYYTDHGDPLIALIDELCGGSPQATTTPKPLQKEQRDTIQLTSLPKYKSDFVGRTKELKDLHTLLSQKSLITVVSGVGGVGKSELVNRYLDSYKDEYKRVAYVQISDDESIESTYMRLFASVLGLDKESSFDDLIRVLQSFASDRNLMIIDDLHSLEDYKKIEPLNRAFEILITSRKRFSDTVVYDLDILSLDDARELFCTIYKCDDSVDIDTILAKLGYHPLFVVLMASALAEGYIEIAEVVSSIDDGTFVAIDTKDEQNFNQHLENSFSKQYSSEDSELVYLLQILSSLPAIDIEYTILDKIIQKDKLKANLNKLVKRGWLSQKDSSYKLHQIIKSYIQTTHPLADSDILPTIQAISSYIDPYDSSLMVTTIKEYIPIIESLLIVYKLDDEPKAQLLDSMTYLYYGQALYKKSLEYQIKALNIRESQPTVDRVKIARSYDLLGIIYDAMGDYSKAVRLYIDAKSIREEKLGTNHIDTATSYHNLAELYRTQGKYKEAEELYKTAISITEELLGTNHISTAASYNNLAELYRTQGNYKEAEELYKKSLSITEELLGTNHISTATSYNNLALLYEAQGKYKEAEELYIKSISIKEELLGTNHIDTATSYNNLANLYKTQGKYKEAEELYKKSLSIREELLGTNHIDTATSYNNIGGFYKDTKECHKALEYLQKCLDTLAHLQYSKIDVVGLRYAIKDIKNSIKKEQKAKVGKRGRYCKDM